MMTLALLLGVAVLGSTARAQEDPPGRVGRVADFNGSVSWWDGETGKWAAAQRNLPLTGGDRVSTADNGRAELRVGSTVLRLGNGTELEVLRLDDRRMVFQLHSGSLALRVRSREIATELEIVTAEARLLPQRMGLYRLDRDDDVTQAGVWRGELRISDERGPQIGGGQRAELARRGARGELGMSWIAMPRDGFDAWVMAEDAGSDRGVAQRFVSPEMTGAEDLDRHGRWDQHPEFGAVWTPLQVNVGWAPYRYGRWAWVTPWGWTWVDDAPWGFAPFHYGRWVSWRERWCWVPGAYAARPVYAPALVAWIGNAGWSASVQIGGPSVGWVPLAPREPFRPHYRATPVYVERINPTPPWRWQEHRGDGPAHYGNQGVPGGMTVVPRDVLTQRQPVPRAVMSPPERPRGEIAPLLQAQPPSPSVMPPRRPESGRPAWRGEAPGRGDQAGQLPLPQLPAPAQAQPQVPPQVPPQVQPTQPRLEPHEARDPREAREAREARDFRDRRDPRGRGDGREDRRGREAPAAPSAAAPAATPTPAPTPSPRQQAPAVAPAAPVQPPAAAPAPGPAPAPSRPQAAERPREAERPRAPEGPRERDDERKRRPEAQGSMRERENLR